MRFTGNLRQRLTADVAALGLPPGPAQPATVPAAQLAGLLRMTGRDAYTAGQGRMRGTLAGLVTVADSAGPQTSVSELVTYLNDAALLAPSILLELPVTWALVDDDSFEVTLEDAGHRVTAPVFLDESGGVRRPAGTAGWSR
jgi:hypothetical protein